MNKISIPITTVFTKFKQLCSFPSKRAAQVAADLGKLREDTDTVKISRKALGIIKNTDNVAKPATQTTPITSSQITPSSATQAKDIYNRLPLSINYGNYPYYNQPKKLTVENIVRK